jgi:hypothetical protein
MGRFGRGWESKAGDGKLGLDCYVGASTEREGRGGKPLSTHKLKYSVTLLHE